MLGYLKAFVKNVLGLRKVHISYYLFIMENLKYTQKYNSTTNPTHPRSKPLDRHPIANSRGFLFKMKMSLFKTFIRRLLYPNIHKG